MVDCAALRASAGPLSVPRFPSTFPNITEAPAKLNGNHKLGISGPGMVKLMEVFVPHTHGHASVEPLRVRLPKEDFSHVKYNDTNSKVSYDNSLALYRRLMFPGSNKKNLNKFQWKEGTHDNFLDSLSLLMGAKYLASLKDDVDHIDLQEIMTKFKQRFQFLDPMKSSHYIFSERHAKDVSALDFSKPELVLSFTQAVDEEYSKISSKSISDHAVSKSNLMQTIPDSTKIILGPSILGHKPNLGELCDPQKVKTDKGSNYTALENARTPDLKCSEQQKLKNHGKRKKKKGCKNERDIFRRSSFQDYEFILSLFFNKEFDVSEALGMSKPGRDGVVKVLNQLAVTIAGGGLGIMMVAASKMVAPNAILDSRRLVHVTFGIGLIWLSTGIQSLKKVVLSVKDIDKHFIPRQTQRTNIFRRELGLVYLKAFALVALSFVKFV